jgi:hypothetical protein
MDTESAFVKGYRAASIILLNFCVMFIALNIVLGIYYAVSGRYFPEPDRVPVLSFYSWDTLQSAYPDRDEDVLKQLLLENWTRPHAYKPLYQFVEPPYSGTYVNIHEAGFRHVADQGPWPPSDDAYNVFVFGGSTTFGYGVSDDETIASHLQKTLAQAKAEPVHVYNFGTSFYFTTLERVMYQELLLNGFIPDAALFLDGINQFRHHRPFYSKFIEKWWADHEDPKMVFGPLRDKVPFLRLLSNMRQSFRDSVKKQREAQGNAIARSGEDWAETTAWVIRRYESNKRQIEAVSASYGVEPVFVWQPMPYYDFDLKYHRFVDPDTDTENYPQGYADMDEINSAGGFGNNMIWAADTQQGFPSDVYIDYMHYSPKFSAKLATEITRRMARQGLLGLSR